MINDWTRSCLPVKVFEYLAQGRPVVSTELPELAPFTDVVDLKSGPGFVKAIEKALAADNTSDRDRRIAASTRFTLQDRARRALELISRKLVMTGVV